MDVLPRLAPAARSRGEAPAVAVLLEGLQAFTPDRTPDLFSAFISAGGVLSVVLNADLFIQAPRRLIERMFAVLQRFGCAGDLRVSHGRRR